MNYYELEISIQFMVCLWMFMKRGEWLPTYPDEYGDNYTMAN